VRRRTLRSLWSHYLLVRERLREREMSGVERRQGSEGPARGQLLSAREIRRR
jgi:hypothetical protein